MRILKNQNTEHGPGVCTPKERIIGRIRKWAFE